MKRLGVFILPPGWDASPSQGYPQHYGGTHLYTWVERGSARVKCLAQEHNTMSPARPRTRTTRSGVERTNHEATAPPTEFRVLPVQSTRNSQLELVRTQHYKSHYVSMRELLGACVISYFFTNSRTAI